MAKPNSYGICLYKIEKNEIFLFLNKTSSVSNLNFFKGKVENGELEFQTAIREMFEETNIYVKKKFLENFFVQENKRKNIGIYLVDFNVINFDTLSIDKKEIFSYEWVSIFSNPNLISKNQKKIFLEISSFLSNKLKYIKYYLKEFS